MIAKGREHTKPASSLVAGDSGEGLTVPLSPLDCPCCTGVDASDLYAIFNGKPLADSELLSLAGIEKEQTLYILGRLLGGGKKRKKKTYTKPKKQKHKHKKIKLRVLKFYKVRLGWCVCGSSRCR